MEEYGETNAGTNQLWELATNSEIRGGREGRYDQVQQWCNHDFFEEIPSQQDYHSQYQQHFHSQTQPYFCPSFHNSFHTLLHPHYNNQPYFTENAPNFFHHPDSEPYSQTSALCNPNFQNHQQVFYPQPHAPEHCQYSQEQEHGYYSQPHAYTDFQLEYHSFDYQQLSNELQPPSLSEDAATFAAILEALKTNPEWFRKREEEEKEFTSWIQGAGTSGRCLEAQVEDNREEEENGIAVMDKVWNLSQEVEEPGIGRGIQGSGRTYTRRYKS